MRENKQRQSLRFLSSSPCQFQIDIGKWAFVLLGNETIATTTSNITQTILIHINDQVGVNVFDARQRATPLFCAATKENSQVIPSISVDQHFEQTPRQVLPLLLSSGADVNQGLHECGVSALQVGTVEISVS